VFSDNVFDKLGRETSVALSGGNNTRCTAVLDQAPPGTSQSCAPGFVNPAAGDYRTPGGRGVTWTLGQADFGP
jgi:hypothetical protein